MTTTTRKRKNSRTFKTYVETKFIDILLKTKNSVKLVASFDGCLLDNYLFEVFDDNISFFADGKQFKYIIARERYINEWQSMYVVIFTDDENIFKEQYELFLEEKR
ncbi:hypothetical protein JDW15_04390 [Aerococcaceae bacterium zg-ZJ1578]|uniref:hypothetical protein n=1 Tax=Aerococcaceae bacterium zg-252 TaxID=2796928 RepID=UPI001A1A98B3|nr:hypothetical protein [Aerococcaceae bacterium zg-1578]MBS4462859.1 hypothetical protein [Aerococcaceae bacterium zg-B36]